MKNKMIKLTIATVFAVAFTQAVQAVPIASGSAIGFSGTAELDGSTVETSTKVTGWSVTSLSDSGTFASFSTLMPAAVSIATPWLFNTGTTIPSFWTVGGWTFTLTSSSIASSGGGFLNVNIAGYVTGNGFDQTAFSGGFSAQDPTTGGQFYYTESLSFNTIPDGGTTVLLLGAAFSGLALIKRKLVS